MRTRCLLATIASLALLGITSPRAQARLEVAASFEINAEADFYEPLGPYGSWVEVGTYGRCWRPSGIAVDWRPYCYGHWEWTDCGWFWVSEEPWGWACYHYGRWVYDPAYFWVWVPGVEWGPAWVTWREGGGYIGWAPLPPAIGFSGGVIVADRVHVEPSLFVFVQTGRFLQPVRPRSVIINNTTIVNKTVNITNIRQENKTITNLGTRKVVVNEGPRVDAISKATSKKIQATPITQVVQRAEPPAPVREKLQKRREQPASQREATTEQPKTQPQRESAPNRELQRERPQNAPPTQREEPRVRPQREVEPQELKRERPQPERPPAPAERREEPRVVEPRREAPPEERPAPPPGVGRERSGEEKVRPQPPAEKPRQAEPPREQPKKHREGEEGEQTEQAPPPAHGHEKD